jgi:uncharacterized membrane protein
MIPIHPVVVHFAIGLTFFGVILDAVSFFKEKDELSFAGRLSFLAGVVAITLAALAGWVDHESWHKSIAHQHSSSNLMEIHENLGWGILAYFLCLGAWRVRTVGFVSKAYVAVSLLGLVLLAIQGHYGGRLVFHEAVGVRSQVQAGVEGRETEPQSTEETQKNSQGHEGHAH